MEIKQPTIKGLFVKTHMKAVEKKLGTQGLLELERRLGRHLKIASWSDVPVAEEAEIIRQAMILVWPEKIRPGQEEYEAGRFHFENFMTTLFAKTVFSQFGRNFKLMMKFAGKIGDKVFRNVSISSEDLGPNKVKIILRNLWYPPQHFSGLFEAWLSQMGLMGIARETQLEAGSYEYVITWKEKIDK